MGEIEIKLDDDVAEKVQRLADETGRTFDEEVIYLLGKYFASKATSDELTAPSGEDPIVP